MHLKELKNIKDNKTLINGALFSIYAFIGRGIGFLILIVLANYIPPSDYGTLSLFNTVVMLMGFFVSFSTYGYAGISFFKETKEIFHRDFTVIFIYLLLSVILISIILLLSHSKISQIVGIESRLLWVALVVASLNVFFQLHTDYYRMREKVGRYGMMNVGNALLNALMTLVLVVYFAQGWMGRVNAQLFVTFIFGVFSLLYFVYYRFFDFHFSKDRMKLILIWGLPQIPHLATNWIRQGCDQYIINYNYSTNEVGLFSFALNLVSILTMIGMAFNSSNSVSIFKILADKNICEKRLLLQKNTRNIFYIYIVAAIVVCFMSFILVPIVLPKYVGSLQYFFILIMYGFMMCMYLLYCNYLFYYGYTKQLMYITFGSSLIHLCLSLLLTHFSLYFTAIIYVVSQSLCVCLVYRLSNKVLNKELVSIS